MPQRCPRETADSSYAPLDAGLPEARALETQGRQLKARMEGLERSK